MSNVTITHGDITYSSTHEASKKPEPLTLCPRCKGMVWSGAAFYQHTSFHAFELSYEHEYAIRHPSFPASG